MTNGKKEGPCPHSLLRKKGFPIKFILYSCIINKKRNILKPSHFEWIGYTIPVREQNIGLHLSSIWKEMWKKLALWPYEGRNKIEFGFYMCAWFENTSIKKLNILCIFDGKTRAKRIRYMWHWYTWTKL